MATTQIQGKRMETAKRLLTQFLIVTGVVFWVISIYGAIRVYDDASVMVFDCSIAETANYPREVVDECRRIRGGQRI